jgi:phosphatidylserine/phosphatidylglycerophosphate/cardiolipin synthase-like enzyme
LSQDEPAAVEIATADAGVWRYAKASRAHVIVDCAEYFCWMREAMLAAEQRILIVGWDFDTRVRIHNIEPGQKRGRGDPPDRLAEFIPWLVHRKPGLEVHLLKWNFGMLKMFVRGLMPLHLLRWWWNPRIHIKFDSAHPVGCSHHQKIVVIDDTFAVCGGIDMTSSRWDTPDHVEDDPRRKLPNGKLYGPWHDATMAVEGDVARVLGDYGRLRWKQAGGDPMEPCPVRDGSPWPEALSTEYRDVDVGLSRTQAAHDGIAEVVEIEALFIEQIARAKRFIYAESQYFASRRIAEAISLRLEQPDPPEIVLINPETAEGWLEQAAMDGARIRLLAAIGGTDPGHRFSIWCPYASNGTAIYVHSKLMIIDDEIVRVGSANFNNRSMGLDSEFDVFIDAARSGGDPAREAIRRLRVTLLAEHTGQDFATMEALLATHGGAMATALDAAPKDGKRLVRFKPRELSDTEKAIADNEALDPERPEEMLSFYKKGGLFRSSIMRKARRRMLRIKQ